MGDLTSKNPQGVSWLTERKEFEIGGLARLRLLQLKSPLVAHHYDRIVIADVFSGSGENVLSENDDPIDGSPLRLLWALGAAIKTKAGPNPMALASKRIDFLFSDIRPDAIAHLDGLIADRWEAPCQANIATATLDASSAIRLLADDLAESRRTHLILVLDPNGPKAFPRDEALDLLARFSGRVDLFPYISATAINRCLRHRDTSGATYDWWLSAIERLDTGFVQAIARGRQGWIREPIMGDPQQWLMLPTFPAQFAPRDDWNKRGYVTINSPRGQAALRTYSNLREAS